MVQLRAFRFEHDELSLNIEGNMSGILDFPIALAPRFLTRAECELRTSVSCIPQFRQTCPRDAQNRQSQNAFNGEFAA